MTGDSECNFWAGAFVRRKTQNGDGLFLIEDDGWLKAYRRGSLKQKRVDAFIRMQGFA